MKKRFCIAIFLALCFSVARPLYSATFLANRYALILADVPVAERMTAYRLEAQTTQARDYQRAIEAAQQRLRTELDTRGIRIAGSAQVLINALFVEADPAREAELRALPGVKAVVPIRLFRRKLNRALPLVNAPAAWNALGGSQNAGLGMKIAILDTGIDQNHPAFQDSSLPIPPGYPICQPQDCSYTNNKVIVARSYVRQLAAGSGTNPAADSRPDDYSPRDRIGHGTATASVAAGTANQGPAAAISGIAPKAYLGNYKIFGSPELNDFSSGDVIILALEDALKDGMDVASLSLGATALAGPLDTGAACGNPVAAPCDPVAQAVENAVKAGMSVVAAAGNEGDTGANAPTLNSIDSPGDAPSAIAAGASTNSHTFTNSVRVPGSDAPASLRQVPALFSDGPLPVQPVTASLRDVAQLQNDGLACTSLPGGSLSGAIALILRGTCGFLQKVLNAQAAGAVGVIFYQNNSQPIVPPGGLSSTTIPSAMISNSDGVALKNFIDANADHAGTLDPVLLESYNPQLANLLPSFSSLGPSTGDASIKPDLVAVGTDMYMATENFDPMGDLYSRDGYTVASGTSFSTPLVAGAAALVKQKNPGFTPAQIKSSLVNNAALDVVDLFGAIGGVDEIGGGKLDAGASLAATVTSAPSSISFGALAAASSLPMTKTLQVTNNGSSAVTLSVTVSPGRSDANTAVTADQSSLTLNPGASGSLSLTLAAVSSGGFPQPGAYEGKIRLQGGSVSLHVPYSYLVGDHSPANIIPLVGDLFDGTVGEIIPDGAIAIKLIDNEGLPVQGAAVSTRVVAGGGSIQNADSQTDAYGIASAVPVLGPQAGRQAFALTAGGRSWQFDGQARAKPAIPANGIVNGASFEAAKPVAPGSYISIFGSALSDDINQASSLPLPLAIDFVNVSFDVPAAKLSLPGRLIYVSPGQINVQIPWELAGQSSVQVKVTIDFSRSNVYTLPLAAQSPSFFESKDASGNSFVAALDENNRPINAGNPALRGHAIQLFANGLGAVTNQPATGDPAPFSPLAQTIAAATVDIGGKQAQVSYSGLAPGFPGLYQLNVVVPPDASSGIDPVAVSIGGANSKPSNLSVQ